MKWRNTVILVLVAAAAAVFMWKIEPRWQRTDEAKRASEKVFPDMRASLDKIDKIEIVRPADTLTVIKKGGEHWEMTSPMVYRANPWSAKGLVSDVEYLAFTNVLSPEPGKPLDMKQYGLDESSKPVTARYFSGEEKLLEFKVGAETSVGEGVYLSRDSDERVYVVAKDVRSRLAAETNSFRSTKIANFASPDVRKLALCEKGRKTVEMERDGGSWKMTFPVADRGSYETVKALLSDLDGLNSSEFVEGPPAELAAKGLEPAELAVSIFSGVDFDEQTVLIGGSQGEGKLYCMRKGSPFLLAVPEADAEKLDVKASSFREGRLASVAVESAKKLTVAAPAGGVALSREGAAWKMLEPAGQMADSDRVRDALQAIKDAKIAEYLESSTPFVAAMTVTVEHEEESRKEEIELSKPDDAGFVLARRKATPGVFKVPAAVYSEMAKPPLYFRDRQVMDLQVGDARRIERSGPGAEAAVLVRGSADEPWALEGKPEAKIDSRRVSDVLWALSALKAKELLGEFEGEALTKYGLAEPSMKISVRTAPKEGEEKPHVLMIGAAAEAGDCYAMTGDLRMVFTLEGGTLETLKGSVLEAEEKKPETKVEPGPEGSAPPPPASPAGEGAR